MNVPAGKSLWETTTTILQGLRDQDNDHVWTRFVEHFRPPIAAFVRRYGVKPEDAEDVTQNTLLAFVTAYREGRYDRRRGRLRQWLFGIAYRQALMQLRSRARHRDREATSLDAREAMGAWDELWDRFVLEKCVAQARREFSAGTFQAFQLVVLDDLTPAEAASRLEVPVKQIYNAKHRVLTRLRALMAQLENVEP